MIDLPPHIPTDAEFVMLFDVSQPSTQKRFRVVDLRGKNPTVVLQSTVAHGAGSDPQKRGIASRFGDEFNSHMTSLGTYRISEAYQGKYGLSYRLDGLSPTNRNARTRDVVLHPAPYVRPDSAGRSFGCPALSFDTMKKLNHIGAFKKAYLVIYTQQQYIKKENIWIKNEQPTNNFSSMLPKVNPWTKT